jgi:predicted nucleotidyltransferase
MSPDVSEVIRILLSLKAEIKKRFKTNLKGIFGSFARSEATPDSDIDILVEFLPAANLFDMAELTLFLEDRLHRNIDLVPESGIREELRQTILREAIML